MPPKRSSVLALADVPVPGWLQTPVASHVIGQKKAAYLSGPYLSAFMWYHDMPTTKKAMGRMNGTRLWRRAQRRLPAALRDASKLAPGGIEALARAFNHGFSAPVEAQDKLLAFLQSLSVDVFGEAARQLHAHYEFCRAFRLREQDLASPPSYIDLFKDDRVSKTWRSDGAFQSVLISANGLLRTWTALMSPGWNPHNAPSDAVTCWEACRGDIEALHRDLDLEGPGLRCVTRREVSSLNACI